jgi:hypothetical protein
LAATSSEPTCRAAIESGLRHDYFGNCDTSIGRSARFGFIEPAVRAAGHPLSQNAGRAVGGAINIGDDGRKLLAQPLASSASSSSVDAVGRSPDPVFILNSLWQFAVASVLQISG